MARIVFIEGEYSGNEMDLPAGGITLGRSADCDLAMNDGEVSGRHAQIRQEDGKWYLTDLQSSNGTMVNGQVITATALNEDDVVEIGATKFIFKTDGAAEPSGIAEAPAMQEIVAPAAEPVTLEVQPAPETPLAPAVLEVLEPAPVIEPPRHKAATGPSARTEATAEDLALVQQMRERTQAIRKEVAKVIVGQDEVLDQILMCIIGGGHALLVGLPGLAKTLMVSTIAKVLNMKFKRIQFTPDLMPSDITGTEVLEVNRETQEKEFRFIKGPIFCNVLLADEINRTPPKTQAALLEAMQEKRVTVGNVTYDMDRPFFVLATQNPIEQEGTYPLPEAQLDRFMFNIWVDYPKQEEEEKIISATTVVAKIEPQIILGKEEVLQLQEVVRKIPVSNHVVKYAIKLIRATRPTYDDVPDFTKMYVSTGAGPRAGQYLVLAAKARAVLEGRIHVSCNDIRKAAIPVMRHRIYTNFAADSEGLTSMDLIKKLLEAVKEPGEEDYTPKSADASKGAKGSPKKEKKP